MILHDVFFVDKAHNKAVKIERLQRRTPLFKPLSPIEETTIEAPAAPVTTTAPIAKAKENPYTKPGISKCYRFGEHGNLATCAI